MWQVQGVSEVPVDEVLLAKAEDDDARTVRIVRRTVDSSESVHGWYTDPGAGVQRWPALLAPHSRR